MTIINIIMLFLLSACSSLRIAPLANGHAKSQHLANGRNYAISTQGKYTSRAAELMFSKGGNAIDAAIAASFVISVERPQSTGLGGGGFMLIHHPSFQEPYAVDFREKAPFKAYEKMYQDENGNILRKKSINGALASGTPGLVAGLLEVHEKYGSLPLQTVVQPAIDLAKNGFEVYPFMAWAIDYRKQELAKYPSSKKIFFKNNEPLKEGDLLVQTDLANTLQLIAQKGRKGFYSGKTAAKIVDSQLKYGGLIRKKDLERYNVKWREPVKGTYKGHEIYSMSPPSSGGTHIIQMLNMIENLSLDKDNIQSAENIHQVSQIMQRAFYDRAQYLGDSDFVKVPVRGLTSKSYAKKLMSEMSGKAKKATDFNEVNPFKFEKNHTTHFNIAQRNGYVVSSTQTINGLFGSALVAAGTGIVMNNEMDDFSAKPGALNLYGAVGSKKNAIAPEKRPLSSMSPTIVLKKGEFYLTAGTPNGTRIISCTMLTLLNVLEFELPLYESVAATRYHHQWRPDYIRVDSPYFPTTTLKKLEQLGYEVKKQDYHCKVQAIKLDSSGFTSVSDPRGEGLAIAN